LIRINERSLRRIYWNSNFSTLAKKSLARGWKILLQIMVLLIVSAVYNPTKGIQMSQKNKLILVIVIVLVQTSPSILHELLPLIQASKETPQLLDKK
jgi:hypothetical protein